MNATPTVKTTTRDTLIMVSGTWPPVGARVTRIAGVWGYWSNGTRYGSFVTREEAESSAFAFVDEELSKQQNGEQS